MYEVFVLVVCQKQMVKFLEKCIFHNFSISFLLRFLDLNSNLNVAGLEIKQLRAGGLTNFVDVFEKLGKQMQDRIAAAEKPEKSRTAEVTHFDMRIQISVYFGSQ